MYCKKCGSSMPENTVRCPACGAPSISVGAADYTAQYDPRDIEDNRVFAALSYLGLLILIPIFCARRSYFARFHANQGLILLLCTVAYTVVTRIVTRVLDILFGGFLSIIPGAFSLVTTALGIIFFVLLILGVVNAATGRARELPLIGRFRLLR
ncbi:MAG: hypothetical protein ACLSD3_14140 [Acutalibacteraceae bacterium]